MVSVYVRSQLAAGAAERLEKFWLLPVSNYRRLSRRHIVLIRSPYWLHEQYCRGYGARQTGWTVAGSSSQVVAVGITGLCSVCSRLATRSSQLVRRVLRRG